MGERGPSRTKGSLAKIVTVWAVNFKILYGNRVGKIFLGGWTTAVSQMVCFRVSPFF